MEFILEIQGITKAFGHTVANDDVSMNVRKGEIHALVGENSTASPGPTAGG